MDARSDTLESELKVVVSHSVWMLGTKLGSILYRGNTESTKLSLQSIFLLCFKMYINLGAKGMAWWLKAVAALSEKLGSVPSTHVTAKNYL